MRQTNKKRTGKKEILSFCVPRVSWEPGYVSFIAHKGVFELCQLSRNVGAGLKTSSAWGREIWLCSTKITCWYSWLQIPVSQFRMHTKPCRRAGGHSAAQKCCQTHWEVGCWWSGVVLPSLIKSNSWTSVFTDCTASLSLNTQQRNQVWVFVSNCICCIFVEINWVFYPFGDTSSAASGQQGWVMGPPTIISHDKRVCDVCFPPVKIHKSLKL